MEKHEVVPNKECGFEEGLARAVTQIQELLQNKEVVFVVINGSSRNVGKTELYHKLGQSLGTHGITVLKNDTFRETGLQNEKKVLELRNTDNKARGVIFTTIEDASAYPAEALSKIRDSWNESVQKIAEKSALPIDTVDLWIAVYSPGRPFKDFSKNQGPTAPLGDIVIRNEGALQKE